MDAFTLNIEAFITQWFIVFLEMNIEHFLDLIFKENTIEQSKRTHIDGFIDLELSFLGLALHYSQSPE